MIAIWKPLYKKQSATSLLKMSPARPGPQISDNDADPTGRLPLDDTHYVVSAVEDTSESKSYLPVVSDLDPDVYKRTGPMARGGNPSSREQLGE